MGKGTYVFIDAQNLYLGIQSQGWELNYKRFRIYLSDKYDVEKAFIFIGYVSKYLKIYEELSRQGYELIFKPTMKKQL